VILMTRTESNRWNPKQKDYNLKKRSEIQRSEEFFVVHIVWPKGLLGRKVITRPCSTLSHIVWPKISLALRMRALPNSFGLD
jgi:hypothetical protein